MIRVYGDSTGRILRVAQTDDPAEVNVNVPGMASTLVIDPGTNVGLVADYQAGPEHYALLGGQLYKDGSPVVVAGPGADTTDASNSEISPATVRATIDLLTSGINAWDGLSAANKQAFVANNFKKVMQILRGVLRIVLWLYQKG